jgi:AraC-like DNA-binding protein
MMRLVAAGLARLDIGVHQPSPSGAHVPRSQKRAVLETILETHGAKAVLSIADAARHMPPEPVVQALLLARDAGDLLARWSRLERFSHGRHEIETQNLERDVFRLTHRARDKGPPPSTSETLLVLAVLTILAEMIGSAKVSLATEAGEIWRENGVWRASSATTCCVVLVASPPSTSDQRERSIPEQGLVEGLRQRLAADPVRRWTIEAMAAEAGAAPRTLQRHLAERSVSFSRLVGETRLQVAASYLTSPERPGLAEIGFLAGYSDQAHFTRSFTRAVGTTPSTYRADFSR